MAQTKTKIVLDADVVIHFMKGDCFTLLLDLFPEYQYLILDIVYDELAQNVQTKTFIDNITAFMPRKLQKIPFKPSGTAMLEYARLITYLTTLDFLYYAYVRKKLTKEECDEFIQKVISKGSKLPVTDISKYVCSVVI